MPELPEVETVRLFLQDHLLGLKITHLEILNPKSFVDDPVCTIGQKITSFSRHGKYLSIYLSNDYSLLVHLKMTGQLIYQGDRRRAMGHPTKNMHTESLPNKSTRVIFTFSNKSKLYFNDQRKFGWIQVIKSSLLPSHHRHLGLDILDPGSTSNYFYRQLQSTSRPIKVVLLDQSKFAGIGNIYANDSLFEAKINPTAPANQITKAKATRLHSAIISIIQESIFHGGSTAKDNKYLRPDGSFGSHQYHFRVYQRAGDPCLHCRTKVERISQSGRSTFFCPRCQK